MSAVTAQKPLMLVTVGLAVGNPLLQPSTVEPWNGHYSQIWEGLSLRKQEGLQNLRHADSRGWWAILELELGIQPEMAGYPHWLMVTT